MEKIMKIAQSNQQAPSMVISHDLVKIIETLTKSISIENGEFVTLNFRDPNYSSKAGGYHPVEISINPAGEIQYITDFAYVGQGGYAELIKELDFDFSLGLFQQMGREYPIQQGAGIFKLFQFNFVSYYQSGVFEVEVNKM